MLQTPQSDCGVIVDAANLAVSNNNSAIHVLLVDDDPSFLEISKQILMDMGSFGLDQACCVDDAFKKLATGQYDVVVSDYEMPKKNGLQFLKELREGKNEIPFILFTGKGREEVAMQALNLGADGYFNKQGDTETAYGELAHGIRLVIRKKAAENEIFAQKEELNALFASSPEAIMISSLNGNVVDCNEAALRLGQYSSKEEIIGKNGLDFIAEKDRKKAFDNLSVMLKQGTVRNIEYTALKKNGGDYLAELSANILRDSNGNPTGFVSIISDITERKKAELALRESEMKFRTFAASSINWAYWLASDGSLIYVSPSCEKITGYKPEEFFKDPKLLEQIIDSQDAETVDQHLKLVASRDEHVSEFRIRTKCGETRWIKHTCNPVFDDKGKWRGRRVTNMDITERKKAEEELQIQKEELQVILDSLPEKIWYKDRNNRLVRVNKAFAEYVGVSKGNLEGKLLSDLFPPDIAQKCWEEDLEVIKTGQPKTDILDRYESAQGVSWFSTSKMPCKEKNGNIIGTINVSTDITERKKAEESLRESEEKYRKTIENANVGIITYGREGEVMVLNPKMEEITGFNRTEISTLAEWFEKLYPNEEKRRKVRDKWFKRMSGEGEVKEGHATITTKEGKRRNFLFNAVQLNSGDSIAFAIDTTEPKRLEEALRESERRLTNIVENSSDQIFLLDRDYRFTVANKSAADLFGMSPQEMVGRSVSEIFPETIAAQFSKNIKNVFDTGKRMFIDEKMVAKGHELYTSTSLNPIKDDSGRVIAVTGIVRDITEEKRVEDEKNSLLQNLEDRVKELNCLYGMSRLFEKPNISLDDALQGTVNLLSPAMQYPDITCARIVVEDREFSTENFQETRWELQADIEVLGKKAGSVEVCYLEERPVIAEGPFLIEERHLVDAIAERLGKTTEREKAKKVLHESEERFRTIFEGANDGILAADVKTKRFILANTKICEITGYSLEELLKLGVGDINPKKDLPYVIDSFTKQMKGEISLSMNIPVLRKDGRVVYCDVSSKPLKIGSQECLVGLFRDATERRKAVEAIRESEEKYRSLFENAKDLILSVDLEGNITSVNSAVREYGYDKNELLGKSVFRTVFPEDYSQHFRDFFGDFAQGKPVKGEFKIKSRTKQGYTIVEYRGSSIIQNNKVVGIQVIIRDITERKEAEEAVNGLMNKLVLVNEKLNVVGSLTRHDVRNKLSAIPGYAYLLKKKHADQADILDGLSKMEQAVKDSMKIFDFAKMYEQLGVEELTYVNVEAKLNEAAALFSVPLPKILNECHGLAVLADSFLRELLYNFIDNTRKYGEKTTTIRVHYEKADQDRLKLIYEDDGVGIPLENKGSLFKEGFSTGGSTGFGLFLIKKMMDVYGWTVQETGEPGKGARFIITIPKKRNDKQSYQLA